MGLFQLLTFPVTGPASGARRVLEVLLEEAERELYNVESIRQQLDSLQERHRLGEVDDSEFERQEERLLERLLEAHAYHQQKTESG